MIQSRLAVIVVPPWPLSAPLKPLLPKKLEQPNVAHLALPLPLKPGMPNAALVTTSIVVIG
jgi:hypothetical protein